MFHLQNMEYTPEQIRERMQIVESDDGSKVFSFEDENGKISSTVYTLFSGTSFVKKDVHIPRFISNWRYGPVNAFAIEYCLDGRMECMIEEECLYISKGDMILSRTDPTTRILQYPTGDYHALSFVFYLEEPSSVLNMHLKIAGFTLERLVQRYFPDGRYFHILKKSQQLENLFETLFGVPKSIKSTYLGIKSLEVLILLAAEVLEIEEKTTCKISRHQVEMTKNVYQYVMAHPEERYAIDELAEKFNVSATHLKKCFQIVYGTSMQKFIREQKMKAAAKVLETTNVKITEVAQMFGYSNISKFSEAFKSVMGEHPKYYSMSHYTFEEERYDSTIVKSRKNV